MNTSSDGLFADEIFFNFFANSIALPSGNSTSVINKSYAHLVIALNAAFIDITTRGKKPCFARVLVTFLAILLSGSITSTFSLPERFDLKILSSLFSNSGIITGFVIYSSTPAVKPRRISAAEPRVLDIII